MNNSINGNGNINDEDDMISVDAFQKAMAVSCLFVFVFCVFLHWRDVGWVGGGVACNANTNK